MMTRGSVLYVYSGKARVTAGGLDLVVRQQLQALVEAGYRVTFVSRGRYEHPLVNNISFKLTPAHIFSSLKSRYYYNAQHRFFSFFSSMLLRTKKFDFVISWAHQSRDLFRVANRKGAITFLNCPASYSKRKAGSKTENYCWPFVNHVYADEECRLANFLLTPSGYARESYIGNGFPAKKVLDIGRGADILRFTPGVPVLEPFRVVFFGLVCDRKGIVQALEAWKKAGVAGGEFWVIGHVMNDVGFDLLENLPDGVVFKGFSSSPEHYLKQCHVQILPTRHEGMAKSLVEGAACGLVTITTRESGFPVIEGETGYFVEREDTDGMAALIRRLASDPYTRQAMAAKSRAYVERNLTWPIFRRRFASALQDSAD